MVSVITDVAPGESKVFRLNDVLLLTKDSPEVSKYLYIVRLLSYQSTLDRLSHVLTPEIVSISETHHNVRKHSLRGSLPLVVQFLMSSFLRRRSI